MGYQPPEINPDWDFVCDNCGTPRKSTPAESFYPQQPHRCMICGQGELCKQCNQHGNCQGTWLGQEK